MGKKLAIKGHPTRGKEVIELLEMMGGENSLIISGRNLSGYEPFNLYYINDNGVINCKYHSLNKDMVILTLEEFLKEYPFKVGDKVHIYVQNDDTDGRYDIEVAEITSMRWNPARCKIAYKMKDINREFYKEEIKCKVDDDSNKTIKDMGKKLAIKGHSTRGKEVIELFKMMGGCECGYCGGGTGFYYYISQFGNIEASCKPTEFDTYIVYTLEEFLEKYPYKVGDVIKFPNNMAEEIAEMKWDEELEDIIYTSVSGCTRPCHVPKNKEEKKINQMSLANCDLDEVEIVLGDKFELKIKDGKYYAVRKKPQYPTNYIDACSVLGISVTHRCEIDVEVYGDELYALYQLLVCRNAYWKIAGEEMGLDKPWKPDWNHINRKYYCIYNSKNNIVKNVIYSENKILAFPTEEMRDAFYENFKNLIEQCKELL